MTPERFRHITNRYADLRVALMGDFCLDRYLELDPTIEETSIETGLPVHNVTRVRAQPGGAGTVLNNLVSLGIRSARIIGFCGEDGEGYELRRCLDSLAPVQTDGFLCTPLRKTFTYCKPLVMEVAPRELSRLDTKNRTPTPREVEDFLIAALRQVTDDVDAILLLDQVSLPQTGVLTSRVLAAVAELIEDDPSRLILADSRRTLADFPPAAFKMNREELARLVGAVEPMNIDEVSLEATALAQRNRQSVFVTMSEAGLLAADASGHCERNEALPVRGPIDIVGAGDCVLANLGCALASEATLGEALSIANAAASVVVHQLGTTGTASVSQIEERLFEE